MCTGWLHAHDGRLIRPYYVLYVCMSGHSTEVCLYVRQRKEGISSHAKVREMHILMLAPIENRCLLRTCELRRRSVRQSKPHAHVDTTHTTQEVFSSQQQAQPTDLCRRQCARENVNAV
jgi:hypothetical protein